MFRNHRKRGEEGGGGRERNRESECWNWFIVVGRDLTSTPPPSFSPPPPPTTTTRFYWRGEGGERGSKKKWYNISIPCKFYNRSSSSEGYEVKGRRKETAFRRCRNIFFNCRKVFILILLQHEKEYLLLSSSSSKNKLSFPPFTNSHIHLPFRSNLSRGVKKEHLGSHVFVEGRPRRGLLYGGDGERKSEKRKSVESLSTRRE